MTEIFQRRAFRFWATATARASRRSCPAVPAGRRASAPRAPLAAVRRAAATAVFLLSLAACSGISGEGRSPGGEQLLQNNLSVASAALAAGQPAVARKLYLALAERFEDAPEPLLGLGYIALQANTPGQAGEYFMEAAGLAEVAPGVKAEALLGAARASFALGDTGGARERLTLARALAEDPSSIAWIENGLAVAAVFEEDYGTAETHYARALRQPSAHPRIAANYVRMLVASERVDDAARTFAARAPSWWEENDRQALQGLIEEARRSVPSRPYRPDPRLLLRLSRIGTLAARAERVAYRAEDGLRDGSPGLVLLAGERLFPAVPAMRVTVPAVPAPAERLPAGPETADPVPALPEEAPGTLLPVGALETVRAEPAGPAYSDRASPASAAASEDPSSGGLARRTGPAPSAPAAPERAYEPAAKAGPARAGGYRSRSSAVERHGRRKEIHAAPAGEGGLRRRLLPAAASLHAPASPASTAAADGSLSRTVAAGAWEHHLGPGVAQSADALLLTAASRFGTARAFASSHLPSSPVALAGRSGSATATHRERRNAAAAAEPAPAAAAPYRPILLASASPQLDDLLWGMQAAGAPAAPADTAAADGGEDRLAQADETGAAAPAPDDEWTVLLGTGQRLSLGVAASAVAIAAPDIADVQLLSPRVLFVMGRSLGRTTVSVLGEDGSVFERDVSVVPDLEPLRELMAGEPGLQGVRVERLPRGVALTGDVDSPEAADRALRLATASLPEGVPVENSLSVGLELAPLRALLAGEPGLEGVEVRRVGRGVALTGEVASAEAAERAYRLAVASLPEGFPVENNLRVVFDIEPVRTALADEPGLAGVQVKRLARGVALAGAVASPEAADRAVRLSAASLPEGVVVENNLNVAPDLLPLQALLSVQPGLEGVEVRRVGRGVALTGEAVSAEAADRAHRLAAASLPETVPVENNLRVVFDPEPVRAILAAEPGLAGVQVKRLARGVALTGAVASPAAADRAFRLAVVSLPEGLLVENNLDVAPDLLPLQALLSVQPGLEGVRVQRVGRSVALTGTVDSVETAERAYRLAGASLPEAVPVENNLRVVFDIEPVRAVLAAEPGLAGVQVKRLARGVALTGDVDSPAAADRAVRLSAASLPEGVVVENNLNVAPDLLPLRALLVGEPGLDDVRVQRVGRSVAVTGTVDSVETAERALRLAVATLPESMPVENNLRVVFDTEPLRAALADEPGLDGVHVKRLPRGVALSGDVASPEAADRAVRLSAASLPEGVVVENNLDVAPDLLPLQALLSVQPGLEGVRVQRVGRSVALTGKVDSVETAERAYRLAGASLPEAVPVENNLRVVFDIEPVRAVLAAEPGLDGVHVKRLPRGVALTGAVASPEAADRAVRLSAASLPEGVVVENNLDVALDLLPLRALLVGEPGMNDVRVQRVGRSVAVTGTVDSVETAERALRLAVATLPDTVPVENNLRVVFDTEPLRAALADEPGLDGVHVKRLPRGVALSGDVASPEAADRAVRLSAASLPEGVVVENNLNVAPDLLPLRALLVGEPGLDDVRVQRVGRSVAVTGTVDSVETAERALRLAVATLPESVPVENNLRVVFDIEPVRAVLAAEPGLAGVQVKRLARGVALAGEADSPEAADRAVRLAVASLPEGLVVENNLRVVLDLEPLRAVLAEEPGLDRVRVKRLAHGVALSGEIDLPEAAERALRLAAASLPEGLPVGNNLSVALDLLPLRALLVGEPGLGDVEVRRAGRGIALTGKVASAQAAERARRLAATSLPEGTPVENGLRVVFDIEPLRAVLAAEPGLDRVQVKRLARGVALVGDVASPEAESRALRLAAASLSEGLLVESNLNVALDFEPLRALLAAEPELRGVRVEGLARGVTLVGDVASPAVADRALQLAAASLPEGVPVESALRVVDLEPLRALLAEEPELQGVRVESLARGATLVGDVSSLAAADRALRLASSSLPEGVPVESTLRVVDLEPLRTHLAKEPELQGVRVESLPRGVLLAGEVASSAAADRALRLASSSLPEGVPVESALRVVGLESMRALIAAEPGLRGVVVTRVGSGAALTGKVGSAEAAERAHRLAVASLPEDMAVENNLRVEFDIEPLRAVLAGEPGLGGVGVKRLARGVALAGDVDSQDAADRAFGLAVASLPEGLLVENNLDVALDLLPLRALLAGEPGLGGVEVRHVGRGVALSGEVGTADAADGAHRLATASLPEGLPVENNLRVVFDLQPLRTVLAEEPGLDRVRVKRLARGVALAGDVDSPEAADRAFRVAVASLPEGLPVENNLNVAFDLLPLRALLAGEAGLEAVEVRRVGRGIALTGEVGSAEAAERARRLAAASLPETVPVENNLRVLFDIEPLRAVLAAEPGLERVEVTRLTRGVALSGDVGSPAAADRALRLAAASLPEGLPVEDNLRAGLDLEPLRALIAGEPGLDGVRVRRVGRGVTLTGEAGSAEAAERAHRFAAASLPEGVPVENNLRVLFDIVPLRMLLAGDAGLRGVRVQRLARGVALSGDVDSAEAADRALRLAAASLPEGLLVEDNLSAGLDLAPLRALLAGEPGLRDVEAKRVGRGVALTGEAGSAEAAERAHRFAAASLPEGVPVENNLRVLFDIEPLRALLSGEPRLHLVHVQRLPRGVALTGEVASPGAADLALRLAAASLPEGLLVENNLSVGLDLRPARALLSGEPGLAGVRLQRVDRGVALTGEVGSAEAAERASRLAAASLPEGVPVENNLRVLFDIEPLRAVLAAEPGLERVEVTRLTRGVALSGDVGSPGAAERAFRLAVASLPEGLLVENSLGVVVDLGPLRALVAAEQGLEGIEVRRVGAGVALSGEVASAEAAERARRLAAASLPEGLPVESNMQVVLDLEPLRAVLAGEPELKQVRVKKLARGVVLTGEVASAEASDRAQRIASASLPEGLPVENGLRVVPDIGPLRAALAAEPGLKGVQVTRLARGVALSGDVASPEAEGRALRLAAASLPEGVAVENNLDVGLDVGPLRSVLAGERDLGGVRVERTGRGVALVGEVGSASAAERASRLAAALLPEGMPVENGLQVVLDLGPLRALLAGAPELDRVQVQKLARGLALTGDVDSHAAADLALRLAAASLPEGMLVESNLNVRLDLTSVRVLLAGEPDLRGVRVKRVGRGLALTGEVGSPDAAERAFRLASASLPEGIPVENNLRVVPDVEPLRALLAGEPGLERVHVQKLARGVALAGDVASPAAAARAVRLAVASLPEGMLVEDNLSVGLDLAPLRALMAAEPGFGVIVVKRVERGVALTGEVTSRTAAERAGRLAAATLPEGALVENNLRVVLDTGPLRAALSADPEFGRVDVHGLARGISLRGEVGSAAAADRAYRLAAVSLPADTPVENDLRIAGPLQVNLEVQIAEVQRSVAEDFGFNWELFGRSAEGDLGGGFRIGRHLPPPLNAGVPLIGTPGTIPPGNVDGQITPSLVLSRTWETIGITGLVDALAQAGLANVLARPNVTANSGEVASFFSGGEFPIPSGIKDGVLVFEYKKYGVLLDFVPTIVDDGRVELTVRPEVSERSQEQAVEVGGAVVPVINVRRAETTVEMGDGESIVIAGLFSSASNEVQSGVPVLKDLPLLGGLFGQTSTRAEEQELIVTVTARLVQAGPAPAEAGAASAGQAGHYYY